MEIPFISDQPIMVATSPHNGHPVWTIHEHKIISEKFSDYMPPSKKFVDTLSICTAQYPRDYLVCVQYASHIGGDNQIGFTGGIQGYATIESACVTTVKESLEETGLFIPQSDIVVTPSDFDSKRRPAFFATVNATNVTGYVASSHDTTYATMNRVRRGNRSGTVVVFIHGSSDTLIRKVDEITGRPGNEKDTTEIVAIKLIPINLSLSIATHFFDNKFTRGDTLGTHDVGIVLK